VASPRTGSWSQCMRKSERRHSMNLYVGRASRLPPSAKPRADLLSASPWRAEWAGEPPALRQAESFSRKPLPNRGTSIHSFLRLDFVQSLLCFGANEFVFVLQAFGQRGHGGFRHFADLSQRLRRCASDLRIFVLQCFD